MFWFLIGALIGLLWCILWLELDAIRCHLKDIKQILIETKNIK